MKFHPDDVVVLFVRSDVQGLIEDNDIDMDIDDACELIRRRFDASNVFDQMTEILTQ